MKCITSSCILLASFLTLTLSGCSHRRSGSGHIVSDERTVSDFHNLSVDGGIDVFVTQGPAKNIIVKADDNLLQYVETKVEDGELHIRIRHDRWINFHSNIKVYISVPNLDNVDMAGSGSITFENEYKSEDPLKASLTGSGDISGKVDVPEITAAITGSGSFSLKGQTRKISVDITGSGDFNGYNLLAEEAEVTVAGSGDAQVSASVKLDAHVFGSGDVNYKGNPEVVKEVAGSGSVSKS